jgi:hypothetical protein
MPNPLSFTFDDYRIRVAEYLGLARYGSDGEGDAGLPTNTHDLALVGRLVNDGYRRFLGENPRWNFLRTSLEIEFGTDTVDSDDSRYTLPSDFAGVFYTDFTPVSPSVRPSIEEIFEADMVDLHNSKPNTGSPVFFAVYPSETDRLWEVRFWPTPPSGEKIRASYRRWPDPLENGDDQSVAGPRHDRTVLAAALAEAELQRADVAGEKEQAYQTALQRSLSADSLAFGRTRRDYGPGPGGLGVHRIGDVTHNGTSI